MQCILHVVFSLVLLDFALCLSNDFNPFQNISTETYNNKPIVKVLVAIDSKKEIQLIDFALTLLQSDSKLLPDYHLVLDFYLTNCSSNNGIAAFFHAFQRFQHSKFHLPIVILPGCNNDELSSALENFNLTAVSFH